MRYRDVHRFDAAVIAAITLVVAGATFGSGTLFVAAAVPVTYLAIGAFSRPPPVASLAVERTLDPETPAPGERTTVRLAVRNDGDRTMPDVRVVDRPPGPVPVSGGSPRGSVSLRPGEEATISYVIVPSQGEYQFDPPLVRLRPLSAVGTVTGEPSVDGATALRCRRGSGEVPLTRGSLPRVGTQPTDSPGPGTEFHSVREYRPGDDIGRIDWRTLAKTGDLSTVNFRETRAAKTVLIVDGSATARRARGAGYPTGAELSAYAADRMCVGLLASGNRVGLTALGIDETAVEVALPSDRHDRPWVPVGDDPATRTRVDSVLEAVIDADEAEPKPSETDGGRRLDPTDLRARFPSRANAVVATPLLDDEPIELIEALADDHPIVVVSPDVTGAETLGGRMAGIERRLRIRRIRTAGATVIDWSTTEPLSAALEAKR